MNMDNMKYAFKMKSMFIFLMVINGALLPLTLLWIPIAAIINKCSIRDIVLFNIDCIK